MVTAQAVVGRHAGELTVTALALGVAAALWRSFGLEWGAVALAAVVVGAAYSFATTEQSFRERERERRAAERAAADRAAIAAEERAARERAEMHRVAELACEFLLGTELWLDLDEWEVGAWKLAPATAAPPTKLSWSAAGILGRGREALIAARIDGWSEIASALHTQTATLANALQRELPGPPGSRRSELAGVYEAAEAAARSADAAASARRHVIELLGSGTVEEQDARLALGTQKAALFDALEQVRDRVVALDSIGDVERGIAQSINAHREAADRARSRQRDLHGLVARAAEQLLRDLAPAPEDLTASTVGRDDAGLRDVDADEDFRFDADVEAEALTRWCARLKVAPRAFWSVASDQVFEMDDRTRDLRTLVNSLDALALENAVCRLADDRRADRAQPYEYSDVTKAVEQLVKRVGELQDLELS